MKFYQKSVLFVIIFSLFFLQGNINPRCQVSGEDYVPGEIIITLSPSAYPQLCSRYSVLNYFQNKYAHLRITFIDPVLFPMENDLRIECCRFIGITVLEDIVLDAIRILEQDSNIEFAERNYYLKATD